MSNTGYYVIMLLAGIGIPVMAALNGTLGKHLNNTVFAAIVLFGVAFICCIGVYLLTPQKITQSTEKLAYYFYLGGLLVAFYVLSITWLGPKLGLTTAILLVVFGQLISSSVIDHFGLFNAPVKEFNGTKGIALLLVFAGLILNSMSSKT